MKKDTSINIRINNEIKLSLMNKLYENKTSLTELFEVFVNSYISNMDSCKKEKEIQNKINELTSSIKKLETETSALTGQRAVYIEHLNALKNKQCKEVNLTDEMKQYILESKKYDHIARWRRFCEDFTEITIDQFKQVMEE